MDHYASSNLAHEREHADPSVALPMKHSKFYALLRQLAEEHAREIQELTEGRHKEDERTSIVEPFQPQRVLDSIVGRKSASSGESVAIVSEVNEPPRPPGEVLDLTLEDDANRFTIASSIEPPHKRPPVKINSLILEEQELDVQHIQTILSMPARYAPPPLSLRAVWLKLPRSAASENDDSQGEAAMYKSRDDLTTAAILPSKLWYIAYPNSKERLLWDLFGMIFIAIDFVMIPFSVFDPPETVGMRICAWIILLFWTADIAASFVVGYVDKGQVIVDPRRICHHYMRTWFLVDLLVVIPDWVSTLVLSSDDSKPGGATRLIRILRVARILRLLRLMKLGRILATVEDRIDSEYVFVVMEVLKLIIIVIMISHILACAFYAIGTLHDGPDTWNTDLEGTSLDYKYFTSLHWSLSKVALESMDLEAKNTRERVFTNSILIVGLFASSSVVSRITMSMLQLQELGKEQAKQFWLLRRYLVERGVPSALGTRIQRFLEHEVERQQYYVPEENVKLLGYLSKHLSGELQSSIAMTILGVHPYINKLSTMSDVTVFRICLKAITRSQCARGDTLWLQGEEASHMYFVVAGVVRYSHQGQIRISMDGDCVRIEKHGYLCEPAIWCTWVHKGFAVLETQSELLELDSNEFGSVVQHHPRMFVKTQQYAVQFVEALKEVPIQDHSDMLDCMSLGLKFLLTRPTEIDEVRSRFGKLGVGNLFHRAPSSIGVSRRSSVEKEPI